MPDRVVDGYGLTPAIAERVADSGADMLITVDNGIASVDGVAAAKARGLAVLVTDHHLPGAATLPAADVIVNPNQPGCGFESKSIAGVGVMFYVLLALRAELRARGVFDARRASRKLDALLPLVALGTVADVVQARRQQPPPGGAGPAAHPRRRACRPGSRRCSMPPARKPRSATTFDFGFALGPRINAAGRLADMTLGIECLLTDDAGRADELARMLDGINRERREIEGGMREQALVRGRERCSRGEQPPPAAVPCSTPTSTKAWSASSPRASRTACTGRPSSSRPAAPRQGARAQGLGPLHCRLSPARCAGPGGQAPPRRAAALRRPCDGGGLHGGATSSSTTSSRPCRRWRANGWTPRR